MLPINVLYYGKDENLPEQRALRAGPLSLVFEAGDLRYIRLGDHEILRRVYVALRDRSWGTIPSRLSNVQIDARDDSFEITYDAENKQQEIDFFWHATIRGDARGTITFTMQGVARSTFLRNRLGFCILHPVRECAGQPCIVEHDDGKTEQGRFPRYVAPHQPFENIRAIRHEVVPGVRAEVRFEGDIFEMEDQRNWTDASFKTYSTPLRLPYPVEVDAGTKVSQSITLSLSGKVVDPGSRPDQPVPVLSIGRPARTLLPRIGLQHAHHGHPLSGLAIERLRALHLGHLRADLYLSRPDHPAVLRHAAAEARALGIPLELAVFLSGDVTEKLERLARLLEEVEPVVRTFLILSDGETSIGVREMESAREHLGGYSTAAAFGSGTDRNFTELNRQRPQVDPLDLVSYPITPQVHAFDNVSMVENLQGQAATVESARTFCDGVPIGISPVTLRPRFNSSATADTEMPPDELPRQVDVRQMSLFGAGWTLGSLKYLSESGVESITYYETSGWRGVLEQEGGPPRPWLFPSLPGSVFPLYHVLADVGEFEEGEVVPVTSSVPLRVDGFALHKEGRTLVLLANLGPEPQRIRVQQLATQGRLRLMDETNVEEAMHSPERFREREGIPVLTDEGSMEIELLPYAIARLDMADE